MTPTSALRALQRRRGSSRSSGRLGPSREAILEASRRLYAVSDYTGVTMRAVAKEVGCRSPSLYHYFQSKDEIFQALVDEGIALYERFLPTTDDPDCMAQLRWRFWRYYEFSKAHPEYFRLLFVERSSPVGGDQTLAARVLGGSGTRAHVDACIRAGLLPAEARSADIGVILWCAIHGAAVIGMRNRAASIQSDVLAESVLRLALDGVRAGFLRDSKSVVHEPDGATPTSSNTPDGFSSLAEESRSLVSEEGELTHA